MPTLKKPQNLKYCLKIEKEKPNQITKTLCKAVISNVPPWNLEKEQNIIKIVKAIMVHCGGELYDKLNRATGKNNCCPALEQHKTCISLVIHDIGSGNG